MRKIGLIGGMSFESTAIYYRHLNEAVGRRLGGLHSAELLLHSLDFQTVVDKQKAGRWKEAGQQLAQAGQGLERAGAQCLLICAVTMHLVADAVAAAVDIPLIHVVDETAHALNAAGRAKPLLLTTRYTMENGFYQERMRRHGIDVVVPEAPGRGALHDIIFDELCAGKVLDASRTRLMALIDAAANEGADAVIFGCTEIGMILDAADLPLPAFDSAALHADAAVDFALREG
ncbi:aspartate/glutamate racemase family protein [Massilia forsythiae]|nr:aspartate/glutamate racemase family protein [Massilia forsythiae]